MKFIELLEGLQLLEARGDLGVQVRGISCDSRTVREGELFVAIRGERVDGHKFVGDALAKGASALLVESPPDGAHVPWARVRSTREALGVVSSRFYGEPSKRLKAVGVTGTNGKTTTTYLLEAILTTWGKQVGVIGTVNYRYHGYSKEALNTTPSSLELQGLLKEMADRGVTHVVMEVSSHALVQRRLKGCHLDVGVFLNLSPEHLDYHKTMEDYLEAKALLFREVLKESQKTPWAIYNADDARVRGVGDELMGLDKLTFGREGDIRPLEAKGGPFGLEAVLKTPWGPVKVKSPLLGEHNLYNIMAAVATVLVLGVEQEAIEEGIRRLKGVPGRLEKVSDRPMVVVDYAHTPDALAKVLDALRPLAKGRVIVVFGCGGDRDRTKRPVMGRIASEKASLVVLTSDNPRGEDPMAIIREIEAGLVPGCDYLVIPDRKEAIREAIRRATPDDLVLIAGKGHETYQIIGERRLPFDDREEARKALEELG